MGFLYLAIKIPNFAAINFLLSVLTRATFFALTRLGLYKPPPEEEPPSRDTSNNYVLILDGSSPCLVPIPVHVVTTAIKNGVPVLHYQDFLLRRKQEEEEILCEQIVCSICLESVQGTHEIRELCNCSHLFHRECLDTWIDEGQIVCPLCRSMLLPPTINLVRCNENRDGVLRTNAHLVNT